jgi:hypothetical protein
MKNRLEPIEHHHKVTLPTMHLEILDEIGVSTLRLETQCPYAWKRLIEARETAIATYPALVTRQRRHSFYTRHEKIIEYLIHQYSNKIPSHLSYVIRSSRQITPKLLAVYPIVLYECTRYYYVDREQPLREIH